MVANKVAGKVANMQVGMVTCMEVDILHNGHMHHRYISVGHMAGAPNGRERQSQACPKGPKPMCPYNSSFL